MRALTRIVILTACCWPATAGAEQTITVAADGSGDNATVQAAIDAVPDGNAERVVIHIKPGTYKQKLTLPKTKPFVTLRGDDPKTTILTNDWNAKHVGPGGKEVGTSGSASVHIDAADFVAHNLTFENSAGDTGQAVAMKATGDRQVYRNCRFLGWQDTLYPGDGRQYYVDCYVEGRVDFIFGGATAVFERCTIRSKNGGYVTAARTPPEQPFGFVFLDCTLTGEGAPAWLGRPWQWDRGRKASVTFIRTKMGPHVRPPGWDPWNRQDNPNTRPAETTRYAEFASKDLEGRPLDVSQRVPWSRQLTMEEAARYTVETILAGSDGWDPRAAK
jgi:pectinesterase